MKKILLWNLVAFIAFCGVFLTFNYQISSAQEKGKRETFSEVIPFFISGGGYFGFFDQRDGIVYIYDEQMKRVLFVYKLDELGKQGINVTGDRNINKTISY